jgi:hypothetical protein
MSYVVSEYDLVTGEIGMVWGYSTQEGLDINTKPGVGYVNGMFDSRHYYVVDGQPTERPSSPVSRAGLTLQGVPNGATLWINGDSYAADGNVELELPMPGTYRLRVECFPYLDFADEVTV